MAQSINFNLNSIPDDDDYGKQLVLPTGFGSGEFTLQLWIRPDTSFPIGPTNPGINQITNWYDGDIFPYNFGGWWFEGNFLLDGHNNGTFYQGTFSLQFYGGGRVRWHFGDGIDVSEGDPWIIQAFPASSTPSLLDGNWHLVSCVRRWIGAGNAALELWVDENLVADTVTPSRTDMTTFWDSWPGYPQGGWFYGAEKQAAENLGPIQYEDYKGLIDEIRFYNRAKTASEIITDAMQSGCGSDSLLAGSYDFSEGSGLFVTNQMNNADSIHFFDLQANAWTASNAPCANPRLAGVYYINDTIPSNDTTFKSFSDFFMHLQNVGMDDTITVEVAPIAPFYIDSLIVSDVPGNTTNRPIIIRGNGAMVNPILSTTKLILDPSGSIIIHDIEILD